MLGKTIELHAAYGRHYKTIKEFKEDWFGGKDFQTDTGSYCSKSDLYFMRDSGIITVFIQINCNIVYLIRFGKILENFK